MTSGDFLDRIGTELNGLSIEYRRLNWAKYTTGMDFGVNEAYGRMLAFLENDETWNELMEAGEAGLDPVDARKAEILTQSFKPFHLSPEMNELAVRIQRLTSTLSGVLNTHRCSVRGRERNSTEIEKLLSSEPDRALRKEAFLSRVQVSDALAEAGFLDLLELRREYALGMGEKDFVSYSLKEQELEPDMFSFWPEALGEILPLMERTRAGLAEECAGISDIMPWDESFISSSIAPELNSHVDMTDFLSPIAELFAGFGFDVPSMNITYDIFPRKNKSEWGYNFPIETGADSRILANVRNRYFDFRVLLHETGHGVHSFTSNPGQTVLNMGISGIASEGIANLFGSFFTRRAFYSSFFPGTEAESHFTSLSKWKRATQLTALGRILFDGSLYTSRPGSLQEIESLRWQTDADLFNREPYAKRPVWANTIHHTTHPIYLHNYLLGDLTCDMLETVFLKREGVGDITERPEAFGEFLREEVIAPSGMYPFPELFRRISGEDLSLSFLVRRIREELEG